VNRRPSLRDRYVPDHAQQSIQRDRPQ